MRLAYGRSAPKLHHQADDLAGSESLTGSIPGLESLVNGSLLAQIC